MTLDVNEAAKAFSFAEATFGQIRASRLAATPRNYEVCYAYAAQHNPSINQIIDDTLTRNGVLLDADLEKICAQFICATDISDRIDMVGAHLAGESTLALAAIDNATEATSACSEHLDGVNETLAKTKSRERLVAIVEDLIQSVATMHTIKNSLNQQLTSSYAKIRQLRHDLNEITEESQRDPLTGLLNRTSFYPSLTQAMGQAAKPADPLCLILTDIDNFKPFNDRWGHVTGDQILRLVSGALKDGFKSKNIVARFGGKTFAVLVPKATLQSACKIADQLRCAVMSKAIIDRKSGTDMGRITLSLGVACARQNDTADTLIERAGACLSAAKRNGRNRVINETDL